jgi:hypothetical protein
MLIRPLRSVALLFISAPAGGAICAHLIAEQYFAMVPSAIVLSMAWLGAFPHHPQILWSLSEFSFDAPKLPQKVEIVSHNAIGREKLRGFCAHEHHHYCRDRLRNSPRAGDHMAQSHKGSKPNRFN